MIETNHLSYKDTAARVFIKNNKYYRYIFNEYKTEYDHLMQSGLYEALVQKQLIIEHEEISIDVSDNNIYKLLYPTQIPFQSYPFEWSYIQWRKAILAYLRINHIALQYGMILKDATPYNFYLTGGKALMFDTSSFMFFKENDSWIAYRQFCEEFFGPIALMHYNGAKWSKLTMSSLRGLPLDFISKQLPLKSWFNLSTLVHIHLHGKYSGNIAKTETKNATQKGFSVEKIKSLNKMLFSTITKWTKPHALKHHWVNYYENDIESVAYLADKERIIREWLSGIKPASVLDIGANTGMFSYIAAEYTNRVIAIEMDEICVDEIEENISGGNITTLIGEVSSPTPNLGLNNNEFTSIIQRAKSDMLIGLAVIHHLYFTNYLSFNNISEYFANISNLYVIIEFINKEDSKVKIISENKILKLEAYSEINFEQAIISNFKILQKHKIENSVRTLYLLEKK
jgi:hypothetical protein